MNLHCGVCQSVYEMATCPRKMIGQPDLEGIYISLGGTEIEGTDINICADCAIKALLSRKPFKRTGNIVKLMRKEKP